MKTMFFPRIPASPKIDMILMRLGYKKKTTILDVDQSEFLENAIKQGLSLCEPQGIMARYRIINRTEEFVTLESGDKLFSKSIAKLLKNSDEAVLMAATVGNEIVNKITLEIKRGEASLGVIMDSVASQTADASVAWIMDFTSKMVRREGKKVTKHRFSPGFGDFSLSNQKIIFELLDLRKLNLTLTEKYMLIPEKSVTAIVGIEKIEI